MPRWGKGRFKAWREEALSICSEHPTGISMQSMLANSKLGERQKPQSVRHGTEMLKRDSRFASHYLPTGQYTIVGRSHRRVLQWTVVDDEE